MRYERSAEELLEEVAMMGAPLRWPHRLLPLKRMRDGESWPDYGLLAPDGRSRIYLRNLFDSTPLAECEILEYDSFNLIVEDGWVVD